MTEEKFFLHQIKHTNGTFDKGIVVKETYESALQGYHAYLGAYAYGQHAQTDFVSVEITNADGICMTAETWNPKPDEPEEA